MVEFIDRVTQRNIAYYIDKKLVVKWDKIKDGKLAKKDEDRVYLVDGRERCQPKGSKVLLSNGEWINIEDIKVGDEVISPQEDNSILFSKVLETCSWFSKDNYNIRELNKNNKVLYSCSNNHLIPINYITTKRNKNLKRKEIIINLEASKLFNKSNRFLKNTSTISSPLIKSFSNVTNPLIEPYSLGVFLGDGSFRVNRNHKNNICRQLDITSNNFEVIEEVSKYYPIMSLSKKDGTNCKTYKFSLNGEFSKLLSELGLEGKKSGNKFIPKKCLLADSNYRLKLLAGLIDTDGYFSIKHNSYSICTKSLSLAEDIKNLVYSLGGIANINKIIKEIKKIRFKGEYYNISLNLGKINIPVKINRKIKNINHGRLNVNRVSIKLEKIKSCRVYGIELDSPSKLYITDNWMVTHNTGKSVFTFQQAKYIDPTFDIDRACFTPEEFLNAIRKAKKGQVVVFDEAFRGLSSKASQSRVNKAIVQALMEVGQRNLIIFIVLPTFFLLELYAAVLRSNVLLHIYKDNKDGSRKFRIYNFNQKSLLYKVGKKKGFSYGFPRVKYRGRFYNTYAIDETAYRNKKNLSFITPEEQKDDYKLELHAKIDRLIAGSYIEFKKTKKYYTLDKHVEWLASIKVNFERSSVGKKVVSFKKEFKIKSNDKNSKEIAENTEESMESDMESSRKSSESDVERLVLA